MVVGEVNGISNSKAYGVIGKERNVVTSPCFV